jgi:anti-sigma factor RsiW
VTPHLDDALAQRFVDGDLPGEARDACRAHAAACGECRALVESYRALAASLDALEVPDPGADFAAAVLARVDARERHLARERRLAVAIAASAALVAAVLLASAGAAAWAPALAGWTAGAADALRAFQVASTVAGPLVGVLRAHVLLACVAAGLPLLLALRRLAVREAEVAA